MAQIDILVRWQSRSLGASILTLGLLSGFTIPASAEITTGGDGTIVKQSGNTFDITGGTPNGSNNLFHSFGTFNLTTTPTISQVANFQPAANVQNIFGRINGGLPSSIDGKLQVTGGDPKGINLYLMNPAGIVFGKGASLDINGAFTATTAKAIDFNGKWFNAFGTNNYTELNGNPIGLAFTSSTPGSIFSAATISNAKPGKSITLVGGTVISTGDIKTAGGNISIATVEGGKYVQIKVEGSILGLNLPAAVPTYINSINPISTDFKPQSLAELLTNTKVDLAATGVKNENGVVTLVGNPAAVAALIPDLDKTIAGNNKALADYSKARANYKKTEEDYQKALAAVGGNSTLVDKAISNAFKIAENTLGDVNNTRSSSQALLVEKQKAFDDLTAIGDSKAISLAITAGDTISKQNREISSGDVITRNLDASSIGEKGGNIYLESSQAIFTKKVTSSSNRVPDSITSILKNGGNVVLDAQTTIKTEGIDSSTNNTGVFQFTPFGQTPNIRGKGGDVILLNKVKGSDTIVDSIQTQAKNGSGDISVVGGNLTVSSSGLFRAIKTYDSTQVRTINTGPLGRIDVNYKGAPFITGVTFELSPASDVDINLKPGFTFPKGISGSRGTISSIVQFNGSVGLVYTDSGFVSLDGSKRSLDKFSIKGGSDLPPDPKDPSNPDQQASKPKSKDNCTPSSTSVASNPTAAPTRSAGNPNAVSADPCQPNTSNNGILQILTDRN